jgi:hypothetical protein
MKKSQRSFERIWGRHAQSTVWPILIHLTGFFGPGRDGVAIRTDLRGGNPRHIGRKRPRWCNS